MLHFHWNGFWLQTEPTQRKIHCWIWALEMPWFSCSGTKKNFCSLVSQQQCMDGKRHTDMDMESMLSLHVFPIGFNIRFSFRNIAGSFFPLSLLLSLSSSLRHVFSISREKLSDTRICPVFRCCLLLFRRLLHEKWHCTAHRLTNLIIFSCESSIMLLLFFPLTVSLFYSLQCCPFEIELFPFFSRFAVRWKVACSKQTRRTASCNWRQEQIVYKPFGGSILNLFIFPWCFHNETNDRMNEPANERTNGRCIATKVVIIWFFAHHLNSHQQIERSILICPMAGHGHKHKYKYAI